MRKRVPGPNFAEVSLLRRNTRPTSADIERKYRHVSGKKSAEEVNWMSKLNEIMDFTASINEVT
jgi:hypothetical protein